jgi:hypothetical protein
VSLEIRPYRAEDVPAVKRFNDRLAKAGVDFQFPEAHVSTSFPPREGRQITQDQYVAVDKSGEVRAGYLLKNETYLCGDARVVVSNYQLPLSEGIADKKWAMAGVQILTDALKRTPHIYCLGMGGTERPLPRMLARFGWDVVKVPFFFKVLNGRAFAREIRAMGPKFELVLKAARYTGVASLGASLWNLAWGLRSLGGRRLRPELVEDFPAEIDAVSAEALKDSSCAAVRTVKSLAERFPKWDRRFLRVIFKTDQGRIVAWCLLTYSKLKDHKQFGDMRLGALVDGLSLPGYEQAVVRASVKILSQKGADLVVSNQTHRAWKHALARTGFLQGPSNFALARSPSFAKLGADLSQTYFNRGDGDGPINL